MEFDHNLLFNFSSIVATFLVTIVTSITVFQKLKIRWPVKVNCWFCNNNTKIWRREFDWWICPSCEQYNGFSKDGDYKYAIPEQHKASLNNSARLYSMKCEVKPSEGTFKNGLCMKCNRNEGLKLTELSNFEPSSARMYDIEIERLKQSLEKKYALCSNCEKIVRNVLHKQFSWLTQYKMIFFKQKPILTIINNGEKLERVFRIFLTILVSPTVYYSAFWPLPIAGIFLQLGACLASPTNKRTSDMLLTFLWICIGMLAPFKGLKLLKTNLKNEWYALEYITQYHVIIVLSFIIGFINIKSRSNRSVVNKTMLFKKLESPAKNTLSSMPPVPNAKNMCLDNRKKNTANLNGSTNNCRSPVNITNLLMTPVSVETPVPIKPTIFSQNPMMFQKQQNFLTMSLQNGSRTNDIKFNSYMNPFSSQHVEHENYSLDDSLSTLSTLSLSESFPRQTLKTPKIFETKVYGTANSDIFIKSNKSTNKKFVLTPPKLKSVTQTSWVAGGYWQAGMDVPSLSRSSSHSSGFGSAGSNFAPSREPSVYNDFDRCSVVSDATQYCYMSRQNTINSVGSCCQQGPSFSFVRPESPSYSQSPKLMQNSGLFQNYMSPSPSFQTNKTAFTNHVSPDQSTSFNDIKQTRETPTQTNHTAILTNSIWLSALLCGSLVFNMIVLCTTLLR